MATEDLTVRWERPPPRPALHVNASVEAEEARALREAYDIDFETGPGHGPAVELEWNGQTFTGLFGVADFLTMAGRVVLSLRKTGHRRRDEALPGTRIPPGERPAKGADMNPSPTKLIVPRAGPDESRRATGPVEIVPAEQRRAVRIIVKGLGAEPGFRARVLAKVEAVLRRARVAPTTATVAFTSEKGSKGGVAIRCAVTAMVPRQPALRVAQVAVTPLIAFDQAVAALDRMLTGAPDRRRTLRRRPKKYYLARRAMEAS